MIDPRRTPSRLPVLALLLANLLLACGPLLVRLARDEGGVGPVAAGFWRLTLALPVLLIALPIVREPRAGRWLAAVVLVAVGGLAFAADLAAWHVGILHTRLGNATLFGNVTALLFPLYGFLVARTWPNRRQAAALAIALAGALLLLGRSYELAARNLVGDLLCIVAGVCYTFYLIAIGRIGGRIGPVTTLTISVVAGIPLLLAFALLLGEQVWPRDWTALGLLALGSQLSGQGLILYAINRVTPLVLGLMLLVQPIVSATIGWLHYGERLGLLDLAGAVAIIAAMLLVRDDGRAPLLPESGAGLGSAR